MKLLLLSILLLVGFSVLAEGSDKGNARDRLDAIIKSSCLSGYAWHGKMCEYRIGAIRYCKEYARGPHIDCAIYDEAKILMEEK